ncbi:hypothetical protein L228DRAFT_268300 [Xylona heveae TC161]|uniref:polynucleotide adenylyltransferase n=1 Tax=Xylona heveae (strain CBS 132557 / TC161) TaxID=1328760 RepID=A0A165H3C8_XYLHT|nr:hypothetical protein L228DRAFT_268300 [Xylona heveae TC161]KZF22929.1 hypothetical protein L228DRAFT_268300 [Xylona heveae TC161]
MGFQQDASTTAFLQDYPAQSLPYSPASKEQQFVYTFGIPGAFQPAFWPVSLVPPVVSPVVLPFNQSLGLLPQAQDPYRRTTLIDPQNQYRTTARGTPRAQSHLTSDTALRRGGQAPGPPRYRSDIHGNTSGSGSENGGRSFITETQTAAMPQLRRENLPSALPTRPALSSHQSNSLPSTPQQRARKLSFGSRSPSPNDGNHSHSPRSAYSESNSTLPPLRRPPPTGCRFETGMAYFRRRIPYSIGGDTLEPAKETPKARLSEEEEKKLSGDMRELYDRLLPSNESDERRSKFVRKLDQLLNNKWPGSNIRVHVFGSSGNLLCTSESDVDICITTTMKELERVCLLANALAEHGMERVICIPTAKVPIVKFWDPELRLACDMNVNNTSALENTRMVKTYVQIDERVRPLAMIIKHWTKTRILNDAGLGGTLSSYTWICMIINFLQTRDPPILPALHQLPHRKRPAVPGKESAFADDIDSLRGFGKNNHETLGELLFHFFRRHGHELDYEKSVISVRLGKLLTKEEKGWQLLLNNRLCVEEPFNISRNLGNTADDTSFRGVHIELRRAFDLIADGAKLRECCDQFVFPAEEERVWEKPPSQPRPAVLTRSHSQSGGRSGRAQFTNSRGHRHPNNTYSRGQQGGRRSSSATAYGNANLNNFHGPQPGIPSHQYFLSPQAQNQLHDQLFQRYQLLQVQESELRFQLMQQAQAQAQAQASAYAQAHSRGQPSLDTQANLNGRRSSSQEEPPLPSQLGSDLFLHPLQFGPLPHATQTTPQTNPASPAAPIAVPELRRSLQRSPGQEGFATASLRSHSQPARPITTLNGFVPTPFIVPSMGGFQAMQHSQSLPATSPMHGGDNILYESSQRSLAEDLPHEDDLRKEYIGYYLGGSPVAPSSQVVPVQGVYPFGEICSRDGRDTQIIAAPFGHFQESSRSPSPLTHRRSLSIDQQRLTTSTFPNLKRSLATARAIDTSGPLVVNGSNYAPPTIDKEHHGVQASGNTSASEDHSYDTSATMSDTQSSDAIPEGDYSELSQQLHAQRLLELHNQAQKPAHDSGSRINGVSSQQVSPPDVPATKSSSQNAQTSNRSASKSGLANGVEEECKVHRPPPKEKGLRAENIRSGALSSEALRTNAKGYHDPALAPTLSPVRESRTPSPTVSRKNEPTTGGGKRSKSPSRDIQGAFLKAQQKAAAVANKHSHVDHREKASGANSVNSHGKDRHGVNTASNGWQQPARKGNKKGGKSHGAPKNSDSMKDRREPLPVNESERKGG